MEREAGWIATGRTYADFQWRGMVAGGGTFGTFVCVCTISLVFHIPCTFFSPMTILLLFSEFREPLERWWGERCSRERRTFADVGPEDADMTPVEIRLTRDHLALGRDQGYLWEEGGATLFQGARTNFRLASDLLRPEGKGYRRLRGTLPDGTKVEVVAYASLATRRVLDQEDPGPVTWPPSFRDPEMRLPSRAWPLVSLPFVASLAAVALARPAWNEPSEVVAACLLTGLTLLGPIVIWPYLRKTEARVRELASVDENPVPAATPVGSVSGT